MNSTRTDPWSPQLCAQESFPATVDLDSTLNQAPSKPTRQGCELQTTEEMLEFTDKTLNVKKLLREMRKYFDLSSDYFVSSYQMHRIIVSKFVRL